MRTTTLSFPSVCSHREAPAALASVGGKARGLVALERLGHPVPEWYAVTAAGFDRVLAASGLGARIDRRLSGLAARPSAERREAANDIQSWLREVALPAELETAIDHLHGECIPEGATVAVRSSAADEDGSGGSFAGLHESRLGIRGRDALFAAVREVWASSFSDEALTYRLARSLPLGGIAMAVVIQRWMDAVVSGVLFTADPVSGDVTRIVLSALHGPGEALVGLGLATDRYTIEKESLAVERSLAAGRSAGAGPAQDPGCLTTEQVVALARAGLAIERHFGQPQDIEFVIDSEGRPFLLQARPVTALAEHGPAAGNRIVWDHENWGENFPGVTLPMTYSIMRRLDRVGYRGFAKAMRIDPRAVLEHQEVFDTFLGYIHGRLYTNRINRHRLLALIPGVAFQLQPLLALLGVRPDELAPEIRGPKMGRTRRYSVEMPALLRLFGTMAVDFCRVRRLVDLLLREAEEIYSRCADLDFSRLQPIELVRVYDEVERRLIRKWRIPLLNALFLRLSYVLLKRLCATWCGERSGSLVNELLRGEEGAASGRPIQDLLDLAFAVDRQPALREIVLAETPERLAERVANDQELAGLAREIERYLDLYPFKGSCELKLEEPTWRERPEALYQVIRSYLVSGDRGLLDPEVRRERERCARRKAEERAFGALVASRSLLPRRLVFSRLLRIVRRLDVLREEVKLMRVKLFGLFRDLLRALDERLVAEEVLAQPGDIFYLGFDEVADYVRGQALTADLRGLVALRRREVEAHRAAEIDDRFITYGLVYHRNLCRARRAATPAGDGMLRGTGCSRGVVTGAVRVLASPAEATDLAGEILVLERAHTGWITFFPAISGLLVERGEILSHCATIAREMGIPAIVEIPGLTSTLRSGETVTMDGAAGTVVALSQEALQDRGEKLRQSGGRR